MKTFRNLKDTFDAVVRISVLLAVLQGTTLWLFASPPSASAASSAQLAQSQVHQPVAAQRSAKSAAPTACDISSGSDIIQRFGIVFQCLETNAPLMVGGVIAVGGLIAACAYVFMDRKKGHHHTGNVILASLVVIFVAVATAVAKLIAG